MPLGMNALDMKSIAKQEQPKYCMCDEVLFHVGHSVVNSLVIPQRYSTVQSRGRREDIQGHV